jgi:hypothetical protein
MHPARAFHHGRRKHTGSAQYLQSDASADYVHDGINGAHFVKVDLVGGFAMNPALSVGNAAENRDSLVLHPIRESAVSNQLLYLGEAAPVIVFVILARMGVAVLCVAVRRCVAGVVMVASVVGVLVTMNCFVFVM